MRRFLPILPLLFLLSACIFGSNTPTPVLETTCSKQELVAPTNLAPSLGNSISLARPKFSWSFLPDANCLSGGFEITVATDPAFEPQEIVINEYAGGELFYTPTKDALQDCQTYYWKVASKTLDSEKESSVQIFKTDFTGSCPPLQECAGNLAAPTLRAPALGAVVHTVSPQLNWIPGEPQCAEVSYRFEVSDQPIFATTLVSGVTSLPSFETTLPYLEDCRSYYWRVTALSGTSQEPSDIFQFWTDLEGTCPVKQVCNSTQLLPPQIINPAHNEIVESAHPLFIWMNNLPECNPEAYSFQISPYPDFSEYAISGPVEIDGKFRPDTTEFQTDLNFLNDCKQYYWKVILTSGETEVVSDVGVFKTDFAGNCSALTTPFGDMINKIRFDCVNPKLTVMTFEFEQPIQGSFVVYIGDRIWNCEKQLNVENVLICPGPWIKENVKTQITLFDLNKHDEILVTELTSPICDIPK